MSHPLPSVSVPGEEGAHPSGKHRIFLRLSAALAAAVLIAFAPALLGGFVDLDDKTLIYGNPHVREGLTVDGVRWAATSLEHSNWHPLAWVAFMTNVELFGLRPFGHHLMSLLLHALCAVLALRLLLRMTGRPWASAAAAGLFALHPLRVESVAWASEIKDPLSGCFFMLTLLAYVRYARSPSIARWCAVLLPFCLGLAVKPMLVTLPAVLLLLDFWPLQRWRATVPSAPRSPLTRLIAEKVPLLVPAGAVAALTLVAQSRSGAVRSLEALPLTARFENTVVALIGYVGKTFWPRGLAPIYPHPGTGLPPAKVWVSAVILVLITAAAFHQVRKRPYLLFGWLWYLIQIAPVSGIIQTGPQAMADRFTYLPLFGLGTAVVWGLFDLAAGLRLGNRRAAVGAVVLFAFLTGASFVQSGYWKSTETIVGRTLAVTEGNWFAMYAAGVVAARQERFEEAVDWYRRALALMPTFSDGQLMLGNALLRLDRPGEAIEPYRLAAMGVRPAPAHNNLGLALQALGRYREAAAHFRIAVRLEPGFADARRNLRSVQARMENRGAP